MKTIAIMILLYQLTIVKSYSEDREFHYYINVCEGDTFYTGSSYLGYVNHVVRCSLDDKCAVTCTENRPNIEEFVIEGIGFVSKRFVPVVYNGIDGLRNEGIKFLAIENTTITITNVQRAIWEGKQCPGYESYHTKDKCIFHVNVYKKPSSPNVTGKEILGLGEAPTSVQLNITGCPTDDFLTWVDLKTNFTFQTTTHQLTSNDPYNCTEYKVSCSNRFCPKFEKSWSDPVLPAKYFNRENNKSGYDSDFSQFLLSQANKSINKPEYGYRRQYACIQQKASAEYANSGENGWAGGFVKHLFDSMAKDKPCESSANYDCLIKNQTACLFEAGIFPHGFTELAPGFFSYRPTDKSPTEVFNNWGNQHEGFLVNAVSTCFNELDQDPNFVGNKGIYNNVVSTSARILRGIAMYFYGRNVSDTQLLQLSVTQSQPMSLLDKTYNDLPNPATRDQLFSQKAFNDSEIKVSAGSSFFLRTNSYIKIDLQANELNAPVNYQLNVDPTIATITSAGILTIHSTGLPMLNQRLPLYVSVTSGGKTGIGQFAIYDIDSDGDMIADTYEQKVGLNPNFKNDLKSDQDGDDLIDIFEVNLGSNPLKKDTDGDGFNDLEEYLRGTILTNANSFPITINSIASGNWNSTLTWSCGCIPTSSADVIINNNHIVLLDSNMPEATCRNLEILGTFSMQGSSLLINGNRIVVDQKNIFSK